MSTVKSKEPKTVALPVEQYFSEEAFEAEKQAVWRQSWLLAGRASDIPNPGDFVVFELEVLETSVLIVRGKDHEVRAFYNACLHQGARLSYECKGSASRLRCSFHGWIYDFEGRLASVPFKELFPGLEIDQMRLRQVHADTWGGFVFVHLAEKPRCSLQEYLQPLPDELARYLEAEDWKWHSGYQGLFKANWKIFVDNQCEGHHANFLHARSIGGYFQVEDIPHTVYPDSPSIMSKIEVSRPASSSTGSVKQTEVSKLAAKFSKHGMWIEKDGSTAAERFPGAINTKRSERWVFDLYVVFPNVVFLFEDDQFVVQRIWPLGPNLTTWELDHFFVGETKDFGDMFNRELSLLQQLDTASEDTSVSEGIHRNFSSGAVNVTYLSTMQMGVTTFQEKLKRMTGKEL